MEKGTPKSVLKSIDVDMGDGTVKTVGRKSIKIIENDRVENYYGFQYTYSSAGAYIIRYEDSTMTFTGQNTSDSNNFVLETEFIVGNGVSPSIFEFRDFDNITIKGRELKGGILSLVFVKIIPCHTLAKILITNSSKCEKLFS